MSRVARFGSIHRRNPGDSGGWSPLFIGSKEYLFRSHTNCRRNSTMSQALRGRRCAGGGVHSGIVRSIELPHKPGEQVTVVMDLNRSTHRDHQAGLRGPRLKPKEYWAISL